MDNHEFFKSPHIPNKRSKGVIVDCRTDGESIEALKNLGVTVFLSYQSKLLSAAVASHPDMTIMHIGGNQFICSPDSYDYYKSAIHGAEIIKGCVQLNRQYPDDISYNITLLGNVVFLNAASNQTEILKMTHSTQKKILNVNQGYTKCNICIVSHDAIITSDKGIHSVAIKNKIDSLLIKENYIELPGYNYGFIGGASGLISHDMLAVNGDITTHPDCNRIIGFCKKHGKSVISLKNGPIVDIGSILPIF